MSGRVDLDALRHGVALPDLLPAGAKRRATGSKSWLVSCSFHDDARPSMSVRYARNVGWVYRCFVCGAAGDVIRYFCETRRVQFREAVRQLSDGRAEFMATSSDFDVPSSMRDRSPFVLACDAAGCGATVGVATDEVARLGLGYYGRELFEKISGWHFVKGWPEDARALCGPCNARRLGVSPVQLAMLRNVLDWDLGTDTTTQPDLKRQIEALGLGGEL